MPTQLRPTGQLTWFDRLRGAGRLKAASFRGAQFFVVSAEQELGRRTVTHEFPLVDEVASEDLGRRARRFNIEAFVIGDDYDQDRDLLIGALELAGPGTLILPTRGELTVALDGPVRMRETTEEGGYAAFQLSFVETSGDPDVVILPDTAGAVANAAGLTTMSAVTLACRQSFLEQFQGLVNAALQRLQGAYNSLMSGLRTLRQTIAHALGTVDSVESDIDDLVSNAEALLVAPDQLYGDLVNLAYKLSSLFAVAAGTADAQTIADVVGNAAALSSTSAPATGSSTAVPVAPYNDPSQTGLTPPSPFRATTGPSGGSVPPNPLIVPLLQQYITQLASWTVPAQYAAPSSATPALANEVTADAAFGFVVQALGVISACVAATQVQYTSSDDAIAVQKQLVDAIEQLETATPDDDVYIQLEGLKAAIGAHLSYVASRLPGVTTYTPKRTLPALVIAHELYGDATRETEIVLRNDVANPAMVTGGQALEVLSA